MTRAWPLLIAGHVTGFVIAPFLGDRVIAALVAAGFATASLAALLPRHTRAEALAVSLVVGLLTMLVSLEGHAWLELTPPIYAGIFLAASFAVAAGAGIARIATDAVRHPWVRIALRVAASWLAAIQILILAFLLSPGA